MSVKTPIRTVFTSGNATGLAEFQSGEFIGLTHGGLGASLSIGSAGQVLKVNSGASALEFGSVEAVINIDGATNLESATLATTDKFLVSDGGSEGRATLDQLVTLMESSIDAIGGNLTVTGNLTVNGTTTTVNSTTTTVDDPIFTLGGDTAPGSDDNKDRGIEFRYHTGSAAKVGFFGFDDSTGKFTFIPDATNNTEVFSGTAGTVVATTFEGNLTGDVTGTIQTAAQANITSLGTLTTLTVDNIIVNGTTIGHTSDTDLISLADGVATVNGELSVTTLDIGGTNITSTATELNLLDGVTATTTELNYTDTGASVGTVVASKVVTADANKDVASFRNITLTGELDAGSLDVSGDIDVDGTANLDVVDIDGAVDLASTLTMASGQELRFVDTNESIKSDGSKLIVKSGGTTFNIPTADGSDGQVIKTDGSGTLSFGDAASSGFVESTITQTPGSTDFDLTKGNNTGSSETPFQVQNGTFGQVIRHLYDLMEPKGASTANNTDLGSSESHVGA
tara:strand:- start:14996 stop:16528 length:1533 start_codon:yes stop_codon:yes gene_type:complete